MRLTSVEAANFLSFKDFKLAVGSGRTIITGPNGVGKSNVGRCLELARAALANATGNREGLALELFANAGHNGASAFRVSLAFEFDQEWERDLVLTYVRAAYACGGLLNDREVGRQATTLDLLGRSRITSETLKPFWSGTLLIAFDAALRTSFYAAWEFVYLDQPYHLVLAGHGAGQLSYGRADIRQPLSPSNSNLTVALTSSIHPINVDDPLEADPCRPPLDLSNTLPTADHAITTHINASTDAGSPIPQSLRDLGRLLRITDIDQRNCQFGHVFWELVRRQIVLTDNRRIPFERRFTHDTFDWPINTRDGKDLPAELFRLKNGSRAERQRYRDIQTTFGALTQRDLDIRCTVQPSHASNDELLIEPVIVAGDSEIPIQFAGAGLQEALVLSALIPGEPGRIVVLDEPAVNVEPTMQRRLSQLLRSVSQCLIITHSPDLVMIDNPQDLGNIVRLAPSGAGPMPMRATPNGQADWARWFRLLEPADVRALLFASKVILCEGSTEVGALRQWWSATETLGISTPEAANIPIISVDGDAGFGAFIEYLDTFGVPWAGVADGPALRQGSHLAKQLRRLGLAPAMPAPASADFAAWRDYWESARIYTLAENYGDDGSGSGEFETYLNHANGTLLAAIRAEVGQRSKPQVGALFAAQHPIPDEVVQLYQKIMASWR
jgi:hypothetical protein